MSLTPKTKFEIIIDSNMGGDSMFDLISRLFAKYQQKFKTFELVLPMQLILERGYIDPILFFRKSLENSYSALARFYREHPSCLRVAETDISDDFIERFYLKAIEIATDRSEQFWKDLKAYVDNMIEMYGHGYEGKPFEDLENLNCYELQALYDFHEIKKRLKEDEEFQELRRDSGERAIRSYLSENLDPERAMLILSDDKLARDYIRDLRRKTGHTIFILGSDGFNATCKKLELIQLSNGEISKVESKWSDRLVNVLNYGYW